MITECGFDMGWGGKCKQPTENGAFCTGHIGKVCVSCGSTATGVCSETMGPLCCGEPLCGNCEHTLRPNGCNSGARLPEGMRGHCRKGDQVFKMWAEEGADEYNAKALAERT